MGENGGERNSGFDGERANVLLATEGTDTTNNILGWGPQIVQYLDELIGVIPTLEYRSSEKELREDASDGPNVNSGRLNVDKTHQNPGRSVPPSSIVFKH